MRKRTFLLLFATLILACGLIGAQFTGAATYIQPLYSTTQSQDYLKDAANQHNGGMVYYVDGNKLADGDGLSWVGAYNDLTSAMAASHANIGLAANRAWAARNIIYVRGDELVEDFTKLAQKTDIIGVGANSGYSKAGITGSWIIPDTVNYMSCRFYNIMFTDAGATPIFDIDTQSGLEFHNCMFNSGPTTTIGLQVEESNFFVVEGCEFSRVSTCLGFSASAIKIVDDTDPVYDILIKGNIISTAGIGIDINETEVYNGWITDNKIRATGMGIDDESDDVFVVDNRWMTDIDTATSTAGYDFNIQLSAGNIQMGATGLCDTVPFAKIAE